MPDTPKYLLPDVPLEVLPPAPGIGFEICWAPREIYRKIVFDRPLAAGLETADRLISLPPA